MMAMDIQLCTVFLLLVVSQCSAQAPGDEDDRCLSSPYVHTYEDDVKILMDSYNYLQLLPGNGTGNPLIESALWNDMSFDGNDINSTTAATYWQQSAGTCQFQIKVCGFRQPGVTQDNWLFTQHISKSFDANTNNYQVEILVDITYSLQACRSNRNPPCNTRFTLYRYITNSQQLPSTSGSGFMNKDNYVSFGTATPAATGARYTETHRFTLQPQQTDFYIAIEDTGTCVIISRLLVYRHNCKSMQTGLVLYPETPAPVSGSSNDPTDIDITCVPNADVFGSPQVTCGSDGMWGPQNPRCECRAGYEDRGTECRDSTPAPCPIPTCPTPPPMECPTVTCPPCPTCQTPVTCPTFPTRPPVVRPGTVRNVRAVNCTILWEPPVDDGGEITEYRVRIYAGSSYSSAPRMQKTVLRASTTRVTPAEKMPTERPVYAIVKAKNSAGLSARWSAPVLVATTTDCP